MKTSKIALTLLAFVFAVAGAFASKSIVVDETRGKIEGCPSTDLALEQSNCSVNGGSFACTVNPGTGSEQAYHITSCTSELTRPF